MLLLCSALVVELEEPSRVGRHSLAFSGGLKDRLSDVELREIDLLSCSADTSSDGSSDGSIEQRNKITQNFINVAPAWAKSIISQKVNFLMNDDDHQDESSARTTITMTANLMIIVGPLRAAERRLALGEPN